MANTLTVTNPVGGSDLIVNQPINITWTWNYSVICANVKIYYTLGGVNTTIVEPTANDGSYSWTPTSALSGITLSVREKGTTGQAEYTGTTGSFNIVNQVTAPNAPSNLVATNNNGDITLTWTDNSSNEDGFKIERNGIYIGQVPANTTTYTDLSVAPGTHVYRVYSFIGNSNSSYSNTQSVTVVLQRQLTIIQTGTTSSTTVITDPASSISYYSATLNGSINPNGLNTNYYFEYGIDTQYGNKTITKSIGNGTSIVNVSEIITGLLPNTHYDYRLVIVQN